MKNASIGLLLATALVAVFSFKNNRPAGQKDGEGYTQDNAITDTVPAKKNPGKGKSKTVPYDSFGKPKKMDTTLIR